jgi:hypothetical protein
MAHRSPAAIPQMCNVPAGLPVVSLYGRVDPGASQREVRARVDSLPDQIRPLAKDRALDHRYRLSVHMDIERIKDILGSERWPPGTIAIFSCSGCDLYEEIPLPRRVREQVMVDATPLARPMLAVLGEYSRACVLVINREAAPSGRCRRADRSAWADTTARSEKREFLST